MNSVLRTVLISLTFVQSFAQVRNTEVDEIITKYIEAKGGYDRLTKMKSLRIALEYKFSEIYSIEITNTTVFGKGYRQDALTTYLGQETNTSKATNVFAI